MIWQGGRFVSLLLGWRLTATGGCKSSNQYFQVTRKEIPGKNCGPGECEINPVCPCLRKSYKLHKTQGQNLIDHRLLTSAPIFTQLVKKKKKKKLLKMMHLFDTICFSTNTVNHGDR